MMQFEIEMEGVQSEGSLEWWVEDNVGYILLNNPNARNAFSIQMMLQLKECVDFFETQSITVLVIRSKDQQHFCAGGDLRDVRRTLLLDNNGALMCEWMTHYLNRLQRLPILIVAVVDGAAIGGGAELTTVADVVLASPSSKIGFVQTSLGVSTGWGAGQRLIEKMGRNQTLQILFQGVVYNSEEAKKNGLFDFVGDVNECLQKYIDRANSSNVHHILINWLKGDLNEEEAFARSWGNDQHRHALGMQKKARH